MRRLLIANGLFGLTLAALSSFGCGANETPQSDSTAVEVLAQNIRFVPAVIEIPAGQKVTLRLKNLDATEHDLEVRGLVPSAVAGGGHEGHGSPIMLKRNVAVHAGAKGSGTIEFQAHEKGTYEVFCTIPGHEQAGMVARLIVD